MEEGEQKKTPPDRCGCDIHQDNASSLGALEFYELEITEKNTKADLGGGRRDGRNGLAKSHAKPLSKTTKQGDSLAREGTMRSFEKLAGGRKCIRETRILQWCRDNRRVDLHSGGRKRRASCLSKSITSDDQRGGSAKRGAFVC